LKHERVNTAKWIYFQLSFSPQQAEEDENENKINIYSSFVVIKHSSRKSCDLISNILKNFLYEQIHYVYCFSDASLNENAKKIFFSWFFWL
jgi:hypothetical protein